MTTNNQFALIVSYYLSRLDKEGYVKLGYSSFNEATKSIGEILDVKPNTIKNMRDEFDPYHGNNRIGWKRELRGSRLKVMRAFQDADDQTLLEIVEEILNNKEFKGTEEYNDIKVIFEDKGLRSNIKSQVFILRGPTGKAAELFFIEYFKTNGKPVNGELIDSRELGCGYDFEIRNTNGSYYIEIKGLSSNDGGVLFTNKEWQTAQKYTDRYYLMLIKNISSTPQLVTIKNPASILEVKKNIYTTIQVSWSADKKNLDKIINET